MIKVSKSKRILADTFIMMMHNSSMDEIRVGSMCKAADLDRKTFYNHFMDKYDLAAWIYDRAFYNAFFDVEPGRRIDKEFLMERSCRVYKEMITEPHRTYYQKVMSEFSQNAVPYYMLNHTRKFNEKAMKEYIGKKELTPEQEMAIVSYGHASYGMIEAMVLGKYGFTPELVAAYQYSMIPDLLLQATIAYIEKHKATGKII